MKVGQVPKPDISATHPFIVQEWCKIVRIMKQGFILSGREEILEVRKTSMVLWLPAKFLHQYTNH
jgi:hypothetical protein